MDSCHKPSYKAGDRNPFSRLVTRLLQTLTDANARRVARMHMLRGPARIDILRETELWPEKGVGGSFPCSSRVVNTA